MSDLVASDNEEVEEAEISSRGVLRSTKLQSISRYSKYPPGSDARLSSRQALEIPSKFLSAHGMALRNFFKNRGDYRLFPVKKVTTPLCNHPGLGIQLSGSYIYMDDACS